MYWRPQRGIPFVFTAIGPVHPRRTFFMEVLLNCIAGKSEMQPASSCLHLPYRCLTREILEDVWPLSVRVTSLSQHISSEGSVLECEATTHMEDAWPSIDSGKESAQDHQQLLHPHRSVPRKTGPFENQRKWFLSHLSCLLRQIPERLEEKLQACLCYERSFKITPFLYEPHCSGCPGKDGGWPTMLQGGGVTLQKKPDPCSPRAVPPWMTTREVSVLPQGRVGAPPRSTGNSRSLPYYHQHFLSSSGLRLPTLRLKSLIFLTISSVLSRKSQLIMWPCLYNSRYSDDH